MKTLFTIACLFLTSTTFAQQDMFWNNYSNYNPAMSGFQYQQHGALSLSNNFRTGPDTDLGITANYNMRLGDKHGIGLNYSGTYDNINTVNYSANYNYQFNLKKAGYLSTGIGVGFNRFYDNPNRVHPNNTAPLMSFENMQLNLGVAHKWKGLLSGVNIENASYYSDELFDGNFELYKPAFVAHSEYTFNIGKQLKLVPRALIRLNSSDDFFTSNVTMTLFDKYSFGSSLTFNGSKHLGFNFGYDLMDKFRFAYSYNAQLTQSFYKNLGYFERGRHQLTLGFLLK